MRAFAIFCLFIISSTSFAGANVESAYFERPLSCPLRFSRLSGLRDQMQSLAATLGKGCTQASQQALTVPSKGSRII